MRVSASAHRSRDKHLALLATNMEPRIHPFHIDGFQKWAHVEVACFSFQGSHSVREAFNPKKHASETTLGAFGCRLRV